MILRAAVCNYREFAVETEISKFFIIQSEKTLWRKIFEHHNRSFQRIFFFVKTGKSEMLRSSHSFLLSTAKNYTNFKALGKKRYLV